MFFALRDISPDFLTIVLANIFVTISFFFTLEALNLHFIGRSFRREIYLIFIPIAMGFYFFTEYVDNAEIRNIIFSVTSIVVMLKMVYLLLTAPKSRESLFSRLLAAIYLISILIISVRVVEWNMFSSSRGIFNLSFFNTFFMLFDLVGSIGTTVLFLFLNFQRMNQELDAARAEAQNYADYYSLAIVSAQAGVWDMDLKKNEVYWDDSLEKLFGSGMDINKKLIDIWNSFENELKQEAKPNKIYEDASDKKEFTHEFTIHHNDKGIQYFMSHSRVVHDKNDSSRMIGLIYDITPLRKAEYALKEAHRKLNILTTITRHDILNSITIVNGFAEILAKKLTDPKLQKMAETIENSGAMITHLISFTGQYQDIGIDDPKWQDIGILLDTNEFKPLLEDISSVFPEPGILIYTDKMFEKVLYNLIENSLKHGIKVNSISFSYDFSENGLHIVYQDDGAGIPEENKGLIFKRGYGENTGMGLFLCREILGITSLTIQENGIPGQGARFEINVPFGFYKRKE
jgi:PAS domain-containing protein